MEAYTVRRSISSSTSNTGNRGSDANNFSFGFSREFTCQLWWQIVNFVILGASLILAVFGYWIKEQHFQKYTKHKLNICITKCPSTEPEQAVECNLYCGGSWIKFYSSELELTFIILSGISLAIMALKMRIVYKAEGNAWVKILEVFVIILTVTGGICILSGVASNDAFIEYSVNIQEVEKDRAPIMSRIRRTGKYIHKISAGSLCILAALLEIFITFRFRTRSGNLNLIFPHAGRIHPENPNIIIVKQQEPV